MKPYFTAKPGVNYDCLGKKIEPFYGKRREIRNVNQRWDIEYSEGRRKEIKRQLFSEQKKRKSLALRRNIFDEVFEDVRKNRRGGVRIELKRDQNGIYGYE